MINRFFNNVSKRDIEQDIKNMMLDWINKNRPMPILNSHILNKLFLGTPNLLTSGYIVN